VKHIEPLRHTCVAFVAGYAHIPGEFFQFFTLIITFVL